MPELHFEVESVEPQLFAASPMLLFKLRVSQQPDTGTAVHSVLLRTQIRIEPTRRHYEPGEQDRLFDLFGEPQRWGQTLRSMLWTHAQSIVPAFQSSTTAELLVPCTFDFNVAATKYFHALEGGDIPLCLLFSGTVFYGGESGALQVAQISWEREANFRLPVDVWRQMMNHYYPNSVWLSVPEEVFERLRRYKAQHHLASWDEALEKLLPAEIEEVAS
ncbi:MAG TPA: DUF6084 family protein [Pirellulales bacterium]|nr:DUF6084 family protein [Pirellulales bacterium]